MQEARILSSHVEGEEMIDIGQHRRPQGAIQPVEVGQRLGGQREAATVLAQFRQHPLVVGTPIDLELVDEHQVAPPLLERQDGLFGERRLEEAQQHDADQLGEVRSDHAAGRADQ